MLFTPKTCYNVGIRKEKEGKKMKTEITNIEAFENDYKSFYNGDIESLDMSEVVEEVMRTDGNYELLRYESNTGYGKTFFFDEELICVDKENEEYDVVATYTGHGNH